MSQAASKDRMSFIEYVQFERTSEGKHEFLDLLRSINEELPEAAVIAAQLANRKIDQALALIDAIADPADKARLYNNVFGTCCSTPQTETTDTDG